MDSVLNKRNLDRIYMIDWIIDRLRRGKDNWDTTQGKRMKDTRRRPNRDGLCRVKQGEKIEDEKLRRWEGRTLMRQLIVKG
jgi:hypothetical protein